MGPGDGSTLRHRDHRPVRGASSAALGTTATVTTDASAIAVEAALEVIASLERRWSRFLPTSAWFGSVGTDGPIAVRPSTALVVEAAMAGRLLTNGWFDPVRDAATGDRPRAAAVRVDVDAGVIEVPHGAALDLGGIAKGWAADVAAGLLVDHGAAVVGVDVGGDVRVCSHDPSLVTLDGPRTGDAPARLALRDGGVAVSRASRVAAVVAPTAAGADILATACAAAPFPEAVALAERCGVTAWLRDDLGSIVAVGRPHRFVLDQGWLAPTPAR